MWREKKCEYCKETTMRAGDRAQRLRPSARGGLTLRGDWGGAADTDNAAASTKRRTLEGTLEAVGGCFDDKTGLEALEERGFEVQ